VALLRYVLALAELLGGLAACVWTAVALLVVMTDPACDTAGCDTGIGVSEYVGVALLAASGTALLVGSYLIATAAQDRLFRPVLLTTPGALLAAVVALSLF
jgi:hypothetical protein